MRQFHSSNAYMETKRCIICDKELALDQFYPHPQMDDGHLNKCKECCRGQERARQKRLRKDPAWVRSERKRTRERNVRLGYGERYKPVTKRRRERVAAYKRAWMARNPEKVKAICAANNALRDGRLTRKPCEVCGAARSVHKHHEDYSKPLEVRWLCSKCHREIHWKE